jgi:hypothetical protein
MKTKTGPRIIHYMIGDGKPPLSGPTVMINHRGVVAEDGFMPPDGTPVVRGTIICVKKEVAEKDALEYLEGDKRMIHKALDHRRSLYICREDLCKEIQEEIDALKAVTV